MGREKRVFITDQEFLNIKERHANGEFLKVIHKKDFKERVNYEYFITLFRLKYGNANKLYKPDYKKIIADYIDNNLTCEQVMEKYNVPFIRFRQSSYKRCVYVAKGKTYKECNYNGRPTKLEVAPEIIESIRVEYSNTLCSMLFLCKKYKINFIAVKTILKDTVSYYDSEEFKKIAIDEYNKHKTVAITAKYLNISPRRLNILLKNNDIKLGRFRLMTKKPKLVKTKIEKPKVMKKKKAKKERDLLATEMQKGNAKLKRREKVYANLPDEVKNKGYLLRIDAKTEIFVKDGANPEIARQRWLDKHRGEIKF